MNYQIIHFYLLIANAQFLPSNPDRQTYLDLLDGMCSDIEKELLSQRRTLNSPQFSVFINDQHLTLKSYLSKLEEVREPYRRLIKDSIDRLLLFIETEFSMNLERKLPEKTLPWLKRIIKALGWD